ncbi:cupin domain-containing protein [Microbacterium sp. A196]|uniref:cupin domain-containing protein n=1 Tax=unclassified Microbacterium TaxID=2609290 RepID=UPI003FD414F9
MAIDKAVKTDYYERLKQANVAALWTIPGTMATEPTLDEVPYVWRAKDIYPLLHESADVMTEDDDYDRRALNASNPKRVFGTSHNIVAGYQLVLPGEETGAHRHSPSAIRLLLHGSGHTTVDGEPVLMHRGDLVLTPQYAWHDHRLQADEPMIWLDGLDVPFVRGQHAQFAEEHEDGLQPLNQPEDASVARYGAGLVPSGVKETWKKTYSPINKYPYDRARKTLFALHEVEGSPAEGASIDYVNPLTGGPVIATIGCSLSMVPAGSHGLARRHTPSKVFCVLEGRGHSIINGERFDWEEDDFFVVPSWNWYQHFAEEGSDVVLFEMTDRPIYEPFGLLREQSADAAPEK